MLVVLTACSPAATPTEPSAQAVETVIVTEVVEVEGEAVVVTKVVEEQTDVPSETPSGAIAEPTGSPLATLEPTSTVEPVAESSQPPFDIEDRRIEVEWPNVMEPSASTSVRLSFVPLEGGFEIVTEFPDDQIQVTEVAVKQFEAYELTAIANLDGVGFLLSPTGDQPRLVTEGEPLTWHWTITPQQTGPQRLTISLRLRWEPLSGEGQAREAVIYSKGLAILVGAAVEPKTRWEGAQMVCLFSLLGLGGLVGIWMIGRRRSSPFPARGGSQRPGTAPPSAPRAAPTAIAIEPPPGMQLSPPEKNLLSALFARYARLVIEREFLSGYSGARTFLALPVRPDGRVDAHAIVKISDALSVQQEYENYENFVKTTLPPATARIQQIPVRYDGLAALQYTFLGGADYTPTSLRQALLENPDPRLLWKLFDTFAPNWWMQHKPYVFRLGQEYDRKMPSHYVLEPVQAAPDATLDGKSPGGGFPLQTGDLSPGMILALTNFPHSERRADGKSLSLTNDPAPGQPPVRVRWLAPSLELNPVGRVVATRWTLLQEACAGLDLFGYPNPLTQLPSLLGERVNGTQSLIHGDLNVENVLVGPGEWVWLIDFAQTREGHTLYDFAHLYAELVAHVLAPRIASPQDALKRIEAGEEPLSLAIREMAARCLFDPKQTREVDLALAVSCLGALKFANLTSHARQLLFLTAAYLVQSL